MDRFQNTRQPNWDWWGELWSEPNRILKKLSIGTNQSVADVGSGNGYFTLPLAELVHPAPVYAIDIDVGLLDDLDEKAEKAGISNIICLEGDARKLRSVLLERIDIAFIANTFHGIEEPTAFAEQAYQSLASDGRLIILNWHDRPKEETFIAGKPRGPPRKLRLTPEETQECIFSVPFTNTSLVELSPYHYALICER